MNKSVILTIASVLFLTSISAFARTEQVTEKIELQDADEVVVQCELGAGEFTITPRDMNEAAIIDITYNPRRVDYMVDYEEKRGKCYIDLESDHHSSTNIDTEDNIWDIVLSKKYPVSLNIDIGACDAQAELGGIPLKELTVDVGAASGVIEFSEPNPIRLEEINIDAGASSLKLLQMGNANFDYFSFDGGAGSFELDLRGKYNGESEISIDVGLGSAEITLPRGVPVRVETDGGNWLSSIDFHNDEVDEVDEDVYESDDFDGASTRIIINVSVGLGSADIYWK